MNGHRWGTVCTGEKQAEVSDIRLWGDYKGDLLWTPEESTWQNPDKLHGRRNFRTQQK
ncbi:hypothetical protein [Bacteroides sp.]|uniref:hypothetical protein n=1 Tax=Bacteroides sp. TaxID=29523 RepID=UPI003994E634